MRPRSRRPLRERTRRSGFASCVLPFGKQASIDWQAADADTGRCEDCIPERWGRRHRSNLAEAAGILVAFQKVDLDLRRLVDAKLPVVVEVTLFDPSFAEGNAVEQGS